MQYQNRLILPVLDICWSFKHSHWKFSLLCMMNLAIPYVSQKLERLDELTEASGAVQTMPRENVAISCVQRDTQKQHATGLQKVPHLFESTQVASWIERIAVSAVAIVLYS